MSKQARKLFQFFKNKKENDNFTLQDMADASGYKLGSMRTKKNLCLKNVYIKEFDNGYYKVISDKIDSCNEQDFLEQISEKKENTKIQSPNDYLINHSKAFVLSAIELHNKPNFSCRYDIVTILIISAWEKLLKAHILKLKIDDIKIEDKKTTIEKLLNRLKKYRLNGYSLIEKPTGIENIKTIGESIKHIKSYRDKSTHFYNEKGVDMIILNLISKNIFLYCNYLKDNFQVDIKKANNLFLLPIGLESNEKSFSNIIDEKHSNTVFQEFINGIKQSIGNLKGKKESSILMDINYSIDENGKNVTNFVLSNEGNNRLEIESKDIRMLYPYDYGELIRILKKKNSKFIVNQEFHLINKKLRSDKKMPFIIK